MPVLDRIIAHAAARPGKLAVVCDGRTLDYRTLAGAVAAMRATLKAERLPPERIAALCIHDPLDLWIVGLAARSLGLTTVHCNAAEDIGRLGLGAVSVIATAAAPLPGLAEAAARAGWPMVETPTRIDVADDAALLAAAARETAPGGHILVTSGTTGRYKTVLIDTANEIRNTPLRAAVLGVSGESLVNVFDFGGSTAIGYQWPVCAWTLGGGVVLHHAADRHRALATPGLTHTLTQPQLLAELIAAPPEAYARNDAMRLIVGGGVLSRALWQAARERISDDVRTIVGATETGTFTITRVREPEDLQWHEAHPLYDVDVADEAGRPVAVGETGLLRVKATGVEAYLNDPEATRTFFQGGFFVPGDLAVRRADGRIALQGRVTDVINVMGRKFATAPIEAALQERLQALAVCLFSAPGEDGEVVHVAIQPGAAIGMEALTAALREVLAGLDQVRVHRVAELPRNAMGKVRRDVLKTRLLDAV